MSDYEFLLKFKNQSVNPEYQTGVATTPVQNTQPKNVQMVSNEAIDTDMTDKVVKTTQAPAQTETVKNTKSEEKSWWESTCNWVEQGVKAVAIKANEYMDIQAIHDSVKEWDLDDDNREYAADMSAASENIDNKKYAAVHTSKIKDGMRQLEVAHRHIEHCDEHVRCGYAEHYHEMHKENQAPIAGKVIEHAQEVETAQKVVENISKCHKDVQAEVVACSAQGTVANKNFSREEKGQVGKNIATEIPQLDETAQAKSFTALAETMHDYEEVITEVSHQVANNVSENVKNDTIKNLSNSQHKNLQETFTKENIERIATEYKKSLGIEEKISEEKIEAIARDVKQGKIFNLENAVKKAVNEETQAKQNPFVTNTVVEKAQQTEKAEKAVTVAPKTEASIAETLSFITIEETDGPRTQLLKQELKQCTSASQVAEILKSFPPKVAKNMFKHISRTNAEALFKSSKDSAYMQAFLLKNGFVKYENVKNHCIPAINKILNVFANVDEYNKVIKENGAEAVDERQFKKDMAQAVLKI